MQIAWPNTVDVMSRPGLALSFVLPVLAAPAQDRRPLSGVVVDVAGKPVGRAEVTVCGETSPGSWSTPPDVVSVQADAEGRFRAMVLDCVEYSAWATMRAAEGVAVSPIVAGVTPGSRHELRLGEHGLRRLQLSGLDQLGQDGLRARLFPRDAGGFSVEVGLGKDTVVPPGMPDGDGRALILAADGAPLAWMAFDRGLAGSLPPRRDVRVCAVDAAAQPLADVELVQIVRLWQPTPPLGGSRRQFEIVLGRTDATGRAMIRWPAEAERPPAIDVLARKPGFASVRAGWVGNGARFGAQPAAGEPGLADDELRFALTPANPITMTLAAGAKAVADLPVLALVRDDSPCGNAILHHERDIVGRTDAAGRVVLTDVADATRVIAVRLGAEALPHVGGEATSRAFPPGQPFFLTPRVDQERQCRLDLEVLKPLSLQVLDVDGGPAAGAVMLLIPTTDDPGYPSDRDPRFRLDPAGRANVLLQPGSWWAFVLRERRAEFVQFDTDAGTLRLQLQPIPQLRIRVRDGLGKPVAFARMELQHYATGPSRDDVPRYQRDLIWVLMAQSWLRTLQSDANGDFALPMFPDTKAELNVKLVAGERSSSAWDLRWVDEPFEVEIR